MTVVPGNAAAWTARAREAFTLPALERSGAGLAALPRSGLPRPAGVQWAA